MADVQISINDLMEAFATENAALAKRAVIAEQKAVAMDRRINELEARVATLTAVDTPPADDAVAAVEPTPIKAAARKRTPKAPQ